MKFFYSLATENMYIHTSPQDATQMLLLFSCNPKNNSNHPEACLDFKFYYDSSLDWKIDFPKLKPLSIPHFSFHQLSEESVLRVLSFDWKTMPINHSVSWQNRCRSQTDRKIVITIRDSISVFCVQDFRGRDLAWYIACVVVSSVLRLARDEEAICQNVLLSSGKQLSLLLLLNAFIPSQDRICWQEINNRMYIVIISLVGL